MTNRNKDILSLSVYLLLIGFGLFYKEYIIAGLTAAVWLFNAGVVINDTKKYGNY